MPVSSIWFKIVYGKERGRIYSVFIKKCIRNQSELELEAITLLMIIIHATNGSAIVIGPL